MRPPVPPFTAETAAQKVRAAEDAWNRRDPETVALAYTADSRWRNRSEFLEGRPAIVAFLQRKWAAELDYRLIKELWAFTPDRIAVRFAYEWHDAATGSRFRSLRQRELAVRRRRLPLARRIASINDLAIAASSACSTGRKVRGRRIIRVCPGSVSRHGLGTDHRSGGERCALPCAACMPQFRNTISKPNVETVLQLGPWLQSRMAGRPEAVRHHLRADRRRRTRRGYTVVVLVRRAPGRLAARTPRWWPRASSPALKCCSSPSGISCWNVCGCDWASPAALRGPCAQARIFYVVALRVAGDAPFSGDSGQRGRENPGGPFRRGEPVELSAGHSGDSIRWCSRLTPARSGLRRRTRPVARPNKIKRVKKQFVELGSIVIDVEHDLEAAQASSGALA